jgi:hypothetical protein
MRIGLHDADAEFSNSKYKFPNLALMKISAFHKAQGDAVEWWDAFENYDRVYSSKIFSFTPDNLYLPPNTIKGGMGYDINAKLPPEIENVDLTVGLDYSLYPACDYALGFITRGCPNSCPWCVVPQKEGELEHYRNWTKLMREDTDKLVLLDNNFLAWKCASEVLEGMSLLNFPIIDFNQGLDCRLVTPKIANRLAKIKWIKYIRFACDTSSAVAPLMNAVKLLNERGISSSKIFVYFLVREIPDAVARVRELRKLGAITLYAQAYRNITGDGKPISKEAYYFATKYIYSGQWRKYDWYDTVYGKFFNGSYSAKTTTQY